MKKIIQKQAVIYHQTLVKIKKMNQQQIHILASGCDKLLPELEKLKKQFPEKTIYITGKEGLDNPFYHPLFDIIITNNLFSDLTENKEYQYLNKLNQIMNPRGIFILSEDHRVDSPSGEMKQTMTRHGFILITSWQSPGNRIIHVYGKSPPPAGFFRKIFSNHIIDV